MSSSSVKTFQYKLRPNKKFVAACEAALDDARFIYNCALEQRVNIYQQTGKGVSWAEQSRQLTDARKVLPDIKKGLRAIQGDALKRLDLAFSAFFSRVKKGATPGFPRFKSRERYHTFSQQYESQRPCPLNKNKLTVPGVGTCRVHLSRPLPNGAKVKQLRVTRRASGWYALLVAEIPKEAPLAKTGLSIGVDVGIKEFATLSDGGVIANPHHLRKAADKLAQSQRRAARKKKGSANRRKAVRKTALLHEKVTNARKDFHHKTALRLVRDYDVIAVEKLNIRNLVKNHSLAKNITDVAWASFKNILISKAGNADKLVIEVDPKYTSQTCSKCGHRQKIPLKVRTFECPSCNFTCDRDHNAAINIINRARQSQIHACGVR